MKLAVVGTSALLLAAACGAVFNGGSARVNVTSSPDNAEVWVDGTQYGVTPVVIDLDKKKDHQISFKHGGYHETTVQLGRSLKGAYVVLDVLGGVVPLVIDGATKSWYVLDKDAVHVNLQAASHENDGTIRHGRLTDDQLRRIRNGEAPATVIGTPALIGR